MDKLIIIKELGHGVFGTTFLVQNEKGNKYALKREKILKGEMIKTTKSRVWREIKFAKSFNDIPFHFMKLYSYRFVKDCSFVNKVTKDELRDMDKAGRKFLKKLAKSSWCIEKFVNQRCF